jgi:DNA-binding transcriptional ArsR family regulator
VGKQGTAPRRPRMVPNEPALPPQGLRSVDGTEPGGERLRLGIVSALAVNESLTFNELKRLMQTTDGNLSVHARKLEDAGYLTCKKSFEGRVPRTEYRIAVTGRLALERYLDHMEALIRATRDR